MLPLPLTALGLSGAVLGWASRSGRTCSPRPFPVATVGLFCWGLPAAPKIGSCLHQLEDLPRGGRGLASELPCQCRWRPPAGQSGRNLLKGESRGERGRGPARPGQVPARSLPYAVQVSLDRLRGWPPVSGRDKVQDPEAHSQGPGPSREQRVEGHRIPGVGAGGPALHAPNLRSPGVLESQS